MLVSFFSLVMLTSMSPAGSSRPRSSPRRPARPSPMKKIAAGLQVVDGVGRGPPGAVGDQRAGDPLGDRALPGLVAVEEVVHHPRAARVASGTRERKPMSPRDGMRNSSRTRPCAVVDHLRHASPARSPSFCVTTPMNVLGAVDDQAAPSAPCSFPSAVLRDDLGLGDRELVALAPHHLDEDRELQLAAAHDLEGVGRRRASTRRETLLRSSFSSRSRRWRRGDVLAFLARERARC